MSCTVGHQGAARKIVHSVGVLDTDTVLPKGKPFPNCECRGSVARELKNRGTSDAAKDARCPECDHFLIDHVDALPAKDTIVRVCLERRCGCVEVRSAS
jgi:hypothetical protein